MRVDLNEIRKRSEYINEQKHSTLPLLIFNYSHKCQYDKVWDEYTMMCRGLITDLAGNIIARPFRKFFNWEEGRAVIPSENPIIYEKMDGSLGIQYYDGDKVCIATRGSFNSDQAKWATKWMQGKGLQRHHFHPDYTYLYEIIYPENRIVVNYGNRAELVLLAMVKTETGGEGVPYFHEDSLNARGITSVNHIVYKDLNVEIERAKSFDGNQEGFVFHWPQHNNLRVKMKGAEYVRLHRLITGFSTKSIWECLRAGQDLEKILKDIPDEFYDWVKDKKAELEANFELVDLRAQDVFGEVNHMTDRKEQAAYLKESASDVMAEVFKMLDGKPYEDIIWKKVRPKHELPFKKDIDA